MVLEKLVPEAWLERKPAYGFLMGMGYSIVGIILGALIFKKDPAIPSVAFTTLFLIPIMHRLFTIEEEEKSKDKTFSWKTLYNQNKDIFWTYMCLFLGIFLIFSVAAATLPAFQVNKLFREQLGLRAGEAVATGTAPGAGMASATGMVVTDMNFALTPDGQILDKAQGGQTVFFTELFWKILLNNWWVLLATGILALLAGEGGIFFVTWNASVWGTIFGVTARNAAVFSQQNALWLLVIILAIVLPHVFLEIGSYILTGISAGIFSSAIGKEKLFSPTMRTVTLYCLGILLVGIVFLFAGALVETYVLGNNITYQTIIANSYFGR